MPEADRLEVSVVYALPDQQALVEMRVPAGTTVGEAVVHSGLPERFPEITAQPLHCAIHGRSVALTQRLAMTDRVEILRPLSIDPKEGRRQAAARSRERARK